MRMTMRSFLASVAFLLLSSGHLQAGMVYLALGDSLTFGVDESTPSSTTPSLGDQGYVRHFADFLGTLNGGVRPTVTNLGISGELASSFLTAQAPADWPYRKWDWNLHYPESSTTQIGLMIANLDAAHSARDSIYVTLNVGSNDFQELVGSRAWQEASAQQQQVLFGQLLQQIAGDYATILGAIHDHAPEAHVLLPSFINPVVASDPRYALYDLAAVSANQLLLQQIIPGTGGTYVDFYSVIHGHEAELANQTGDNHLNQAGYSAVALALDAAAVPEPHSLLMLSVGIVGLLVRIRRGASARMIRSRMSGHSYPQEDFSS